MPSCLRRLVALLVLPVFAAAGCGGGASGGDASTATLLKDTFSGATAIRSGRLDLAIGVQAAGLKALTRPIALKLTGPFQSQGSGRLPKFDFAVHVAAGGSVVLAGAESLGDRGFLKLGGRAFTLDQPLFDRFRANYEKSRSAAKGRSGGPSLSSLGVHPAGWLKDATNLGKADVGGTSTFHIHSAVDVPRFLADVDTLLSKARTLGSAARSVPQGLSAKLRATIESSVRAATLDVYTGVADHALRRLALSVSLQVPAAARKAVGGLTSGELRFDLTIADLNVEQTISAPANPRPLSELQQAVGALSGLGTPAPQTTTPQTTTPQTTTPQTTTPSSAGPRKYLDCVHAAGSDVVKAQGCAALINGG